MFGTLCCEYPSEFIKAVESPPTMPFFSAAVSEACRVIAFSSSASSSVDLLQKGAEGRGRKAQMIRRMLMVEVEKGVMTCQIRDDENRVSLLFNLVISLHKNTNNVQSLLGSHYIRTL